MNNKTHFEIKIDTNKYAGNFEREMCAYVTGQIGECEVGSDIADEEREYISHIDFWDNNILQVDDGEGCERPCAISATEGFFNNGMGGHYVDTPENEEKAKQDFITSQTKYQKPHIQKSVLALETGEYGQGWTKEGHERNIKDCESKIQNAIDKPLTKWPAYQSVSIYISALPSDVAVFNEMRQRVHEYAKNNDIEVSRIQTFQLTTKHDLIITNL